jgi:hypothetical protein
MTARFIPASCLLILAAIGLSCAPHADAPRPGISSNENTDAAAPAPALPTPLKDRIDAALENVHQRDLYTTHAFWTVFHGILGMGLEQTTLLDQVTNQRHNAIDYICKGGPLRGLKFVPMGVAGVDVETQPGFGIGQGHQDQFVAEMSQWGMPLDKKFLIDGKEHTFRDFVHYSKARVRVTSNQELSWAILIVSQYFGTDISWTNEAGENVKFEDVVRYELDQPIDSAACGGTHRLFGLTWAYHLHMRNGGNKTGVWKDVADRIDFYKKQARKFQNPDSAFSTNYVSQPGNVPDIQIRIGSTGHVLEWLALALTKEELSEPWVQEAASALAVMILENQHEPIEGGALYHAVHGLHIYRARVFGTPTPGLLMPAPPTVPSPSK